MENQVRWEPYKLVLHSTLQMFKEKIMQIPFCRFSKKNFCTHFVLFQHIQEYRVSRNFSKAKSGTHTIRHKRVCLVSLSYLVYTYNVFGCSLDRKSNSTSLVYFNEKISSNHWQEQYEITRIHLHLAQELAIEILWILCQNAKKFVSYALSLIFMIFILTMKPAYNKFDLI